VFSPGVRQWFQSQFAEPTPAQVKAWPAIAGGGHVLLAAPTGSGKTLAAFLWALDRLGSEPARSNADSAHTRVVYISPLKSLAYDIERNLRAPLRGIGADLRVGIRTGDTPQRERAAMLRNPPDILITTPESLYLLLTSRARETLKRVEAVIVDEIHAVAATKRGAHLALSLERLEAQVRSATPEATVQRIGLSATQNPLEEIARFLVGPRRTCQILDAGIRKPLDLKIHIPVESMVEPDRGGDSDPLDPLVGGEATRRSIWPAIYPELLTLVREHRSTIIFVNNRRSAERLALRLNELAAGETETPSDAADARANARPVEIARAHHGSLAREERMVVEELLKAGEIPCIVATSSLELGIDMGAVDLVLQVESPKSVAAGLQRIGRAGHNVGDISKGRIFPKFRADLLECAVVAKRMREGAIEPTVVPRNPLDVLAQQIVAMAAANEEQSEGLSVDELHELITATHSFSELSRELLENVLDMLDGRYPSSEFSELRPRIVWDRVAGRIRPRQGARQLAITNAGTIPDRGLYMVTLPDGRRVGELDEEMVYEARPGQTFMLGASTWRIEEIGRDRVIVTPAPGVPGAVPFWKGDGVGRPKELGEAIGAFARWAVDQSPETLGREYDLDERAARNLLDYLREQQEATRVIPSDKTIVIERFRDEIGDWRLCVLSPYGGRVHAAWGLALSAHIRSELGLEADAIYSDDGIIVHLPDADEPPSGELVQIDPECLEDLIVSELSSSALFGARFRENAARALLIPRAYPGKRTPLWQQRLKSQSLLEVAKRYEDFPIVLETYRECMRDVLDLPGLRELLSKLHRRELSLVEVETATASPFASSLLFDYVATYMYEGDIPNAERRAAALSLDRDLLRELLGSEELRELIDPGALEQVQDDLQHRSERTRASTRDELHDVLRRTGDISPAEASQRVSDGVDAHGLLVALEGERRAVRVRIGGQERFIDAADAGLYRDALGTVLPGGLPGAFLADVPEAMIKLMRRYGNTHAPFTTAQPRGRYGLDPTPALRELERAGELVRGELHPDGADGQREWCDAQVLRRLRRASLAALRKEIEPAERRSFAAFLSDWHGIDRHPAAGAGIDRLREQLVPLQGLALTPETWERDVLPRRVGAYSNTWMDQLCASGELVWVGAGALGRASGRVALYFREDVALIGPPMIKGLTAEPLAGEDQVRVRGRLTAGSCFFTDLLTDIDLPPAALQQALWDLVWVGEVTNDAFAPLRAPRLTLARSSPRGVPGVPAARSRFASRRGSGRGQVQGRWSLTAPLFADLSGETEISPPARRRALAELLLERHGILTRELVLAEGVPGGFSAIYGELCQLETLGIARRGYFVEGLGGAQFALPGAVERLRAGRAPQESPPLVLAATDPAQPYGAALPWPKRERARPARSPGASVVLAGAEPVLYLERSGKALQILVDHDDPRIEPSVRALVDHARAGNIKRIALEKIDGEPVIGSSWESLLALLGFHTGPRRLTLSA
jgi:ATP-dependent Lhr-like helicase